MSYFPVISINNFSGIFEAVAGVKLVSILHGSLLDSSFASFCSNSSDRMERMNLGKLYHDREALLHALSSLSSDIAFELHIDTMPNIALRARGEISITLFLRTRAGSDEEAKERLIKNYLVLMPLLVAHVSEAEFSPITTLEELEAKWTGESFRYAQSIERRKERLVLTAPIKRGLIGFGSRQETVSESELSVEHVFPWKASSEDWSALIVTLLAQLEPVRIIVRLRPIPLQEQIVDRLRETIETCDNFLAWKASESNEDSLVFQATMIRNESLRQLASISDGCFALGIFMLYSAPALATLSHVLGKAIAGLSSRIDEKQLWTGGFACHDISASDAIRSDYFTDNEPFSVPEAVCAFRMPNPPVNEIPGLPIKRYRTSIALLPFENMPEQQLVTLAVNEHQGMRQYIDVNADDRCRHTFIAGQTGTGKSTFMESMIIQDIRAGRGVAVIDPHGDMVDSIIGKIPEIRYDDVIVWDLLDKKRPIGFNLLQWETISERDLIIDELYMTLHHLYDLKLTGGPIFESNFRGMLKLLMGDKPRVGFVPTLVEFPRCYLSEDFREYLARGIEDPQILDFIKELERTSGEASLANLSPYITSKFSRFIHDITMKRIVGQESTGINFEEIMNQGKVLLLKLGKGRFGSVTSALLANQIISRFKLAAMKRGEMARSERRFFFVYVDECHNLPAENFMELLAEARKYRMGLVLSTQYMAQLTKESHGSNDNLLSAVLGNVGTLVLFRLGSEDAVKLEEVVTPYFQRRDIIGLPNWCGYMRTQVNNQALPPFSFKTVVDDTPFRDEIAQWLRTASAMKYGMYYAAVDEEINRRRSCWSE